MNTDPDPAHPRLYPVGRLDADTSGLILLTNDGELANRLTHPTLRSAEDLPRKARRRTDQQMALYASLRRGVELDDGPTAPARVRRMSADLIELTIHEGRNRQVRRMCEAVGHPVLALERVAFGPLRLDASRQAYRRLDEQEIERLRAL